MTVLAGPPQAIIAYTGFILVPLGHGTTIQPACAALFGLILATVVLHERPTIQRIIGGTAIIAGLIVFGIESLDHHRQPWHWRRSAVLDAGFSGRCFGMLLRLWRVSGMRAVAVVGALSVVCLCAAVCRVHRL